MTTGAEVSERRLILFRHAKSSWSEPLDDHERPLSPRGLEAAPLMGKRLRKRGMLPDLVLCSTSKRTRATWDLVAAAFDRKCEVRFESRIYDASPSRLLLLLAEVPDTVRTCMLIAHQPALQEVLEELTGNPLPSPKFSTAAFALIEFDAGSWRDALPGSGRLAYFSTPKMPD